MRERRQWRRAPAILATSTVHPCYVPKVMGRVLVCLYAVAACGGGKTTSAADKQDAGRAMKDGVPAEVKIPVWRRER